MQPRLVAEGVDATTWPKDRFDHRGHLAAGAWWCHIHGTRALTHARQAIPRFNEAKGGENTDTAGYHETLTVYYLAALSELVADACPDEGWFQRTIDDAWLERAAPLRFWSDEVLMSTGARRRWVEPDRCDLPVRIGLRVAELLEPGVSESAVRRDTGPGIPAVPDGLGGTADLVGEDTL